MAYIPLFYENINLINGTYQPSPVKNRNNLAFDYWVRTLFHRAQSSLVFDLPDIWQGELVDFWYYVLFKYGVVSIQDITKYSKVGGDKIGMCFNAVGLTGFDFYYQPTTAILSNQALTDSIEMKIGEDCVLVKLNPDYFGCWDVLEYYAEKLSNLDNAINMSIINNKLAFVLGGKTKAAVQTLKKIMDKINAGEPSVFVDYRILDDAKSKETPFQFLQRENLKNSYLTSDQLMDLHTILSDFDAEVGIPTVPYQKKERETEYESKSKYADGMSRALTWKRCIDASLERVKQVYPDLDIKFRLRWEGGVDNVNNEDNTSRS